MLETNIVNETIQHVAKTSCRFTALMQPGVMTYPIPFFGRLSKARVVTLGLNPSNKEFAANRNWNCNMSPDALTERLISYFESTVPPHPFFKPWSEALKHIKASYASDSVHLDLSPRATCRVTQFNSDPRLRSLFLKMLCKDAPIWIGAMEAIADRAEIILAAGSATKKYYINEFIKAQLGNHNVRLEGDWRRGSGPGQTAFHTLILPSGRQIPLFFCSTGPSNGAELVKTIENHASEIKANMYKEIVEIQSRDYWIKVVDMLQQNWALIDANSDNTYTVFFIDDESGVFDKIDFKTLSEARRQLTHNGFLRYDEDKETQKFISRPEPPFHK